MSEAISIPGMVLVDGTRITSAQGVPAQGTIFFTPVLEDGSPATYELGGGGLAMSVPIKTGVVNGAFHILLPDTSLTDPPIGFSITVTDVWGNALLTGYSFVQPHAVATSPSDWCQGGVCDFDYYLSRPTPAIGPGDTHTEALTDGFGNFIYASGDVIYVTGVPN